MCVQRFIKILFNACIVTHSTYGFNISNFKPNIKIIGGNQARIAQFPYQVSLRANAQYGSTFGHFCGGSILNDTHILTAAHCLYSKYLWDVYVVAGAVKLSDNGQQRKVKSFSYHSLYTKDSFKYDIGILRLYTPLDMNNFTVKAVPLQQTEPLAGTLCTVSGWGLTSTLDNASSIPNTLRYVEVPISDWASCVRNYSKTGKVVPEAGMLCAGVPAGGKDACSGDSGGPLVCGGHLAGVVSWGAGCAERNLPGVYTDVALYRAWILANSGTIVTIEYRGLYVFVILGYLTFYLIKVK